MQIPAFVANIIDDFFNYSNTADKKLIEHYRLIELENTLAYLHDDVDMPYYSLLKNRINDLKTAEFKKRTTREKWIDRLIGSLFTICIGVILLIVKRIITGVW